MSTGPCPVLFLTSKFRRKLAESGRGGKVQAFSEMIDHASPQCGFFEPFVGASPGMMGFEDCGSLFTHLKHEEATTEKYLARYFLGIKQSPETAELDNEYWLPGV